MYFSNITKKYNNNFYSGMSDQPIISAKSWILMDNASNEYWRGSNTMDKLEMASLTKMYTFQACLDINELLNIRPESFLIQIVQSTQNGTQSGLIIGKWITIDQVYYALMLPSGNDAALNLAYYYGYLLGRKESFKDYEWKTEKSVSLEGKKKYNRLYLARFIAYMNQTLIKQKLKQKDTHFQNPHGLPDKLQKSTAWQISNAVMDFLKHPKFAEVTRTQKYKATYSDGEAQQWVNTNILLKDGYIGIKTGYTPTAGGCLCSRKVVYHKRKRYDLILVILGCKTQEDRFRETRYLIEDFQQYLKVMY